MWRSGCDSLIDVYAANRIIEKFCSQPWLDMNVRAGNKLIRHRLQEGIPTAISRLGACEMEVLSWHLGIPRIYKYQRRPPHFDELDLAEQAGVFPPAESTYREFSELYLERMKDIDVWSVWYNTGEAKLIREYGAPGAIRMDPRAVEPYYCPEQPWSEALSGKRVLVVHPYAKTISRQLERMQQVWSLYPRLFPKCEVMCIQAPYGFSGNGFASGAEMVKWIEDAIDSAAADPGFDVALIACGGAGLPVTSHVKNIGKIGIYVGGALQLFFGIRGKRWENWPFFQKMYNDSWVQPELEELPPCVLSFDSGAYW